MFLQNFISLLPNDNCLNRRSCNRKKLLSRGAKTTRQIYFHDRRLSICRKHGIGDNSNNITNSSRTSIAIREICSAQIVPLRQIKLTENYYTTVAKKMFENRKSETAIRSIFLPVIIHSIKTKNYIIRSTISFYFCA